MVRKLFGFKKKVEAEVPVAVEIPVRAVEGSNVDLRLIVKTGKRGKSFFMKSPCVGERTGCDGQFDPIPSEDGKTFCRRYIEPAEMWTGLNHKGEPKTCLTRAKPKAEKDSNFKLNPLKASKRGVSQVVAATDKESKDKKKIERRDSR